MKQKHYRGKYATEKKPAPIWCWIVPAILLIISLTTIGMISLNRRKARSDYQQMTAAVHEIRNAAAPTEVTAAAEPSEATEAATVPTEPSEAPTEPPGPLPQYQQLYAENPEMAGWLYIEETCIDYPVMHTPEDPEKYLHRNFQGEESYAGVPFIDYRCKADSDNLLIYGHNMADGTMFHTLVDYEKEEHWKNHPVIHFDSVEEERQYEVVAAFYDRIYYTHETNFKFYNFIDAADEAEYNSAVEQFKRKSLYDTGVTPQYGQQLITLVTCTYHVDNGRFVVVACEKE